MSGIVNKVKEALHSDNSTTHNTSATHNTSSGAQEGSYGPHGSRVANAADPRVDSDRDGSHNTGAQRQGEYGSTTGGYTHGTGPTHASHSTGLGSGNTSGTREGEHGPHGSRTANALDPRVDSDRDGSHNAGAAGGYGSTTGGYTHGTGPTHGSHTTGLGASTGSSGFGQSTGTREGEHGPHGSRTANALDPRVDSDRDGSHNTGSSYGTGNTFGSSGHTGTREGEHGPHGSRTANAVDPRVDSDRDGSRNAGAAYGTGHSSGTGFTTGSNPGTREGEHGPHSSRTANALDPRVDSDRDGSRNAGASYGTGHSSGTTGTGYGSTTGHNTGLGHTGHSGPGPASNTAGPHSSDMANKLDPRVDSDLDGSKTVGGNKTYQSGAHDSSLGHRDPTDAAQVPPSVLRQTIGEPTLEHDDHHHGRDRRNSSATHQETYRGV